AIVARRGWSWSASSASRPRVSSEGWNTAVAPDQLDARTTLAPTPGSPATQAELRCVTESTVPWVHPLVRFLQCRRAAPILCQEPGRPTGSDLLLVGGAHPS